MLVKPINVRKTLKTTYFKLKTACSLSFLFFLCSVSSDFSDILGTCKVQTSVDKSQILNTVKQKYNLVFKK